MSAAEPGSKRPTSVKPLKGKAERRRALVPALQRQEAVARAAYGLAEQRGFEPGREMEDWLLAESRFMDAQAWELKG